MLAVAVIDTSVFVADAMSQFHGGASSRVLDLALTERFQLVMCDQIRDELVAVLVRKLAWTVWEVQTRFGAVFDRATWVAPVPEAPHHLAAVQGHSADTVVVRTAEAIYVSQRPDLVAIQAKYVVSMNTRHFPPGATYAGFVFTTPHDLLAR